MPSLQLWGKDGVENRSLLSTKGVVPGRGQKKKKKGGGASRGEEPAK